MAQFRLAIVDASRETGCMELQQLLPDENGKDHWVHYIIVRDRAQAVKVVGELEPDLAEKAAADLASSVVLDSAEDRNVEARMAKHLLGWGKAAEEYRARTKPAEVPAPTAELLSLRTAEK